MQGLCTRPGFLNIGQISGSRGLPKTDFPSLVKPPGKTHVVG